MASSNTLLPFPSYLTFRRYTGRGNECLWYLMVLSSTEVAKGKEGKKRTPSPSSVFTHFSPASDALS